MEDKHIVIIGAGFAGLETLKKFRNKKGFKITVVDKNNHHLFQPLLYQVASSVLSPADIAIPIRGLTTDYKNITIVLSELKEINFEHKKIHLEHTTITYDYLVLAMGAVTSYFGNDHWKQFALGLKSLSDALKIRNKILVSFERAELETNPEKIADELRFVIIGGGPTGVEMSGAIAELSHHIIKKDFRFIDPSKSEILLIEAGPRLLSSFDSSLSDITKKELEKRGVKVLLNTKVVDINENGVQLANSFIHSKNIIWSAGVSGNPLAQKMNIELDRSGRIIVDQFCKVPRLQNVFAIGDLASFKDSKTGIPLPGVSPVAMQQGRYVADFIKSEVNGKKNQNPFQYTNKGIMATIGRKDAVGELPFHIKLSGFIGWLGWLALHLFYQVGFKNKLSILITWMWSYISFKAGARLIYSGEDSSSSSSSSNSNSSLL
jgi:NADH dehydrogenase